MDKKGKMRLSKNIQNISGIMGICSIIDLGNAQQVRLNIEYFKQMLELTTKLEEMGFTELVLTVEKNCPIVVGDLKCGFVLAPMIKDVD